MGMQAAIIVTEASVMSHITRSTALSSLSVYGGLRCWEVGGLTKICTCELGKLSGFHDCNRCGAVDGLVTSACKMGVERKRLTRHPYSWRRRHQSFLLASFGGPILSSMVV